MYAGKEAVTKALCGVNIGGVPYRDIEILYNDLENLTARVMGYESLNIKISLSYCRNLAVALALVEEV